MAANKSTPGITRKKRNAGCTGCAWGTTITSAIVRHLRLFRKFSPRNMFENTGADQQRRDESHQHSPRIERQFPATSGLSCICFCTHRSAPLCDALAAAQLERISFGVAPIDKEFFGGVAHINKWLQPARDGFVRRARNPCGKGFFLL